MSEEFPSEDASSPVVLLQRKTDPSVIEVLELLLEEAKAGRISGFTAMSCESGGQSRTWAAGYWGRADALWSFEHWKHRLLLGERL